MNKPTTSLCLIYKDDFANLKRLLSEARPHIDEIVVVQTGIGADDELISLFPMIDKYYHEQNGEYSDADGNITDFSKPRNKSFDLATQDYIFWLDSDDTISSWDQLLSDVQLLDEAIKNNTEDSVIAVLMQYQYSFITKPGQPRICTQSFLKTRLFRRADCWHWEDPIHEFVTNSRKYHEINGSTIVIHLSDGARGISSNRNLRILRSWEKQTDLTDRQKSKVAYYIGDELLARRDFENAMSYFARSVELGKFLPELGLFRLLVSWNNKNSGVMTEETLLEIQEYLDKYSCYARFANFGWFLAFMYNKSGDKNMAINYYYKSFGLPLIEMENPIFGLQVASCIWGGA